uniref:Uncharacterized protein n=1 Tax=Arundo donax TaxID=35708 RepID=A0A0A9G0C1_ARUDO
MVLLLFCWVGSQWI